MHGKDRPTLGSGLKKVKKRPGGPPRPLVIVDDETSYVELLSGLMSENLDCPVHGFTRPKDALQFLGSARPGVIVTDYFMPEMDGLEFIRRASRVVPDAAFVMISGHNLEPMDHELRRLKRLRERIQKPFGWRILAEAVLRAWPGEDVPLLRMSEA